MNQKPAYPKRNLTSCLEISLILLLFLYFNACKTKSPIVKETEVYDSLPINEKSISSEDQESFRVKKEQEIKSYQESASKDFDILHMELDLEFDWQRQAVLGKAKLKVKPFFYPQKILVLDAKDYEMGSVNWIASDSVFKLSYRYNEKSLSVYLPRELTSKDTFELEINYTAFPERNSGEGSEAITDTKGLYFIDPLDTVPDKPTMIWTQGETEHNSKWFPTIDKPNERFTHTIRLTVPDSMVSISNGVLVKQEKLGNGLRKDHWEMNLPHAPYLVALAVGDFGKVQARHGSIPLGYFVERGFEKGVEKVFKNTPEMMTFFEEKLGIPFPWPKYDQIVVRDFVSGAMENTTASIFMEELRLDEREALDSEWDYIIAHELFHQWFGDLVTTESWANLTLNEAFANYSEYLWNEHHYGKDQAALKLVSEMEGYFAEAEDKQVDLIRFDYADSEDMFDAHSYNKGGVVLHMLRDVLGDEAFFKGLNEYLKRHAFQSVEVHDLRLAFEKVSGKDLNWFFNQWFLAKGHPELKMEVDYSEPENILLTITQLQDLNEAPLFQFPIEVSWYSGKERISKRFMVSEGRQSFALENVEPIKLVYVDEGKNVLAIKSQELSNDQLLQQFRESKLGVARYEALDSLVSREARLELGLVIPQAIKDPFWPIRENILGLLQSDNQFINQLEGLEDEIYELAEKDPKNSVRSAAIDLLGEWNPDKYQFAFKRMAHEPSYLVAGSALMAFLNATESGEVLKFIEGFSDQKNFRMIIPVSEYYITQSISGRGDWFQTKLSELKGEGLYYFLGYYGEYFSRFPEEGKVEAIGSLLKILKENPKDYVRMGAFQALLAFADEKEVLNKIDEAVKAESSFKLKNYFNYYLEMLRE